MGFQHFLRDYFTFNRRERNGVFIFLSIILILILYLSFSDYLFQEEKIDFSKFEKEITAFEAEQKRLSDSIEQQNVYFSGNSLVYDSGHSEDNYKKKIYKRPNADKETVIVELNSADTTELKKLKGIGSAFAKRIVKFRDVLGGFVAKEQLLEVYGLDKEKFNLILRHITLNTSIVKKININSASVSDLDRHPYIYKKIAVEIFTQRVRSGDYQDVEEIKKLNLIDDELYSKIAPYLIAE